MAVRCGIDLGTTYSGISWFDADRDLVDTIDLETADGNKVIRSVVFYPGPGSAPVVGETAWNSARQSPDRVIVGIKRSMGMAFETAPIDGVRYTPPQVSAEILKTLAADAKKYLGEDVTDVIVTVPAHFGDNERAATMEAGRIAGLNVLELLSEPQAAALAVAVGNLATIVDKYLLVYDLGGGTFDVTLVHTTLVDDGSGAKLNIDTLCKDGNASLGGLDWDRALAEIVREKVQQAHGIDVTEEPANEAVLLDNCEKAKRHLTRTSRVSIVADLANHQVDVSAAEFEDRTRDLLLQTQMLVERVLEDAERQYRIGRDQIEVLLSGGSSRMPMVKRMIEGLLGRPPLQHRNPELLVTMGAAYWAHFLQAGNSVSVRVTTPDGGRGAVPVGMIPGGLTDIASHAVGVETVRPDGNGGWTRFNAVIVPVGASYAKEFKKRFQTTEDGMTEIEIVLYKGDSPAVADCEELIRVTIAGLPTGRPAGQPVDVSLQYDRSGVLRGAAVDVETGKACEIVFDRAKSGS